MKPHASLGLALVKIASLYLLGGLLLGMVMAVSKDFTLVSVHSHMALLGWAAMATTGLAYLVVPKLADSWLARAHFWMQNIGLPVMIGSLAWVTGRNDLRFEALIGLGSMLVAGGLLAFTVNLLMIGRHAGSAAPERPAIIRR